MNTRPLEIYFAGDLFDAKDLGGNLLLADAIEKISNGKFKVMLPQAGECEVVNRTSQSIRNADFRLLYSCDLIVANFDGTDLDSGTVVEYCFAKMLDMPAVLLRTDFRNAGDGDLPDGEPWNLMCSHYPRTEVRHINAMERYHRFAGCKRGELLKEFYNSIAQDVCDALEAVTVEKSWLTQAELSHSLSMAQKSIGAEIFSAFEMEQLVRKKLDSNLYRN